MAKKQTTKLENAPKLSPMMEQYCQTKEKYKDTLLFYRLGDFYEMFFDDAITASRELDITLTGRDCGLPERAPMCGVPFHAIDSYLPKLLEKGYKVAICEQVTKPGEQKGLVERRIVREITPGTKIDSEMLDETKNNYLMSLCMRGSRVGASWVDISTGEFNHVQLEVQVALNLNELLGRIKPAEIICNGEMLAESVNLSLVKFGGVCPFTAYNEYDFEFDNALKTVKNTLLDCSNLLSKELCVCSSGALLRYLEDTQKRTLKHITHSELLQSDLYMNIDVSARRTLELTSNASDGKVRGSLYWFMNRTCTSMGARLLRKWIEQPSAKADEINRRLTCVERLLSYNQKADALRELLKNVADIERLAGRASYGNISPKDCRRLGESLLTLVNVVEVCRDIDDEYISEIISKIDDFTELGTFLVSAIDPSPAAMARECGVIAKGFDSVLDEYRELFENSRGYLKRLEEKERELTGIKNLKISYNRVFGYYIEVSKSQVNMVPYRYVRRQTLTTGERYITDELKDLESKILNAEESAKQREIQLYEATVEKVKEYVEPLIEAAKKVAILDCVLSHANVALECGYVKPKITSDRQLRIIEGRHCVVEKLLGKEKFVPNDTVMDDCENITILITGPNMAGKSIYMRQVALIAIMAQCGCYVPAKSATIGLIDRIFTRVGASDDLSTGRSTFMVEMSEVADILSKATDNSLLLLDEIGRGTATFDGLSIAWAIIDYITTNFKARTLFSTHYHELTELEGIYEGLKNYKMTVREYNGSIIFLRKLMRGSANKSFGIEVAGLAGLPQAVLSKAKELLKKLEKSDIARKERENQNYQLSIFSDNSNNEIISIIKEIDLDNLTPRKAMDILFDLREKVDNDRN